MFTKDKIKIFMVTNQHSSIAFQPTLLVKPFGQAGLNSMEVVQLLFRSLQTELAAPVCKTFIVHGHRCRLFVGYLRKVDRKVSSLQACVRWGLWLIHAFTDSNDEVRSAV